MQLRTLISTLALLAAPAANASVIVNFWEDGGNVYSYYSGTLDLDDLTLTQENNGAIIGITGTGGYHAALGAVDRYGTITYNDQNWTDNPDFQAADELTAGSTNLALSGDGFVIFSNLLTVADGYVSESQISGGLVWFGQTLDSLQLNVGTYNDLFTWGSGENADSVSFVIGMAPIPVPASFLLLGSALGGLFLRRRRKPA